MIMHREVVRTKRVQAIMILLFVITIALYVVEITELTLGRATTLGDEIIQWIAIGLIFIVTLKEYKRCKFSYKYSIIADKLIINKVCSKNDLNLQSVKVDNILFIGRKKDLPKEFKRIKCKGIYIGDIFSSKRYYCVYKKDDKKVKFSFEPSERLVKAINDKILINDRKAI